MTIVPADTENFQINFDAFEAALNPNVQVVLINTPNNPSGAVYSADTLKRLAAILTAKQVEYGHDIFLISDETVPRNRVRRRHPALPGQLLRELADLLLVVEVAEPAWRTHRLCPR